MTPPSASRPPPQLRWGGSLPRNPERIGLVEADIAAGIPGVVALLRSVAHLGPDHDRLADAVDRPDREHLVGVGLKDLLPGAPAALLVDRVLPFADVIQQPAGGLEIALLALPAVGLDEQSPFRPL